MDTFSIPLASLQPSQFCLSINKLQTVLSTVDISRLRPFPVRSICGNYALTDNHHTAFLTFLMGKLDAEVWYDTDDMDWEAYERSVNECRSRGVRQLADFIGRLVSHVEYENTWCAWCDEMHELLEKERQGARNSKVSTTREDQKRY
jgi:hypothetical protein